MFRRILNLLMFSLLLPVLCRAQKSYHEMVEDYIVQYRDLAVAEQLRSGIPAAITLAQGIYETGAGSSELCTNAANHFGIKCKNNWTGDTYTYSDDRKDECFRKYKDAVQSYRDHSDFLKNNPRYDALFRLDPNDYADWARGLKKCGYATNPVYAQKIIQTIEDYQLQEYTSLALGRQDTEDNELMVVSLDKGMPAPADNDQKSDLAYQNQTHVVEPTGNVEVLFSETKSGTGITGYYEPAVKNGLKGFYARKGDLLLEYAIKHHIRYAKLLEWNDLPDAVMPADLFIYLGSKRKTGLTESYTVMPGMTLLQVSQETGVQLEQLRKLNQLSDGEQPVAGAVLYLQNPVTHKPQVYVQTQTTYNANLPVKTVREKPEYIYVNHDETAPSSSVTIKQEDISSLEAEPAGSDHPETDPLLARSGKEDDTENIEAQVAPQEEKPAKEIVSRQQEKSGSLTEATQLQPVRTESEMTPLERLKAHMDQVVYGKNPGKPSDAGTAPADADDKPDQDAIVTLPAKRQAAKTEPSPATVPKTSGRFYMVRSGDTAFGIARKFNISLSQLREWNHLPASMTVQKGMKLRVAK